MKEIVTIQLGPHSNATGTHFWNQQDELYAGGYYGTDSEGRREVREIDDTPLYRSGVNDKGKDIYTPRLIIFDLKGTFNSLF
jgi:hypothetical protein